MARRGWHGRLGASIAALAAMLPLGQGGGAARAEPQAQSPKPQTGLVLGTVVDADSGLPVPGAIVTAFGTQHERAVLTNSDGRFLFTGLGPGAVSVTARKPGYAPGTMGRTAVGGVGRPIALAAGERRSDVTIKVWRLRSISGVVTDDHGERAVDVRVQLFTVARLNGSRSFIVAGTTSTDDRGAYRFSSLSPGSYYVAAPQATTSAQMASVEPETARVVAGDRRSVYRTVFYPAAETASRADAVDLQSGADREGVDLQLRLVQAVMVSGILRGLDRPVPRVTLRLRDGLEDGAESTPAASLDLATTVSDSEGRFTFVDVPAGAYTIVAHVTPRNPSTSSPPQSGPSGLPAMAAQVPLSVGEEDIDALDVVMATGGKISGRLEFEGSIDRPTAGQIQRGLLTLHMLDADPALGRQRSVSVPFSTDGHFEATSLLPGRYVVATARFANWVIRSVIANGRDATTAPFQLGSTDISGVVVTYTDQTTDLEVQANALASGGLEEPLSVFVFPADVPSWLVEGMLMDRTRSILLGPGESARIRDLPAGEYIAVATGREEVARAMTSPEEHFRELARLGQRVTLRSGVPVSVRLSRIQEAR